MIIYDYNQEYDKVILLLHPVLSNHQIIKELIADKIDGYRFIIPDLSGHGKDNERTYECAINEVMSLVEYFTNHNIKSLTLAYGASLGAAILMELLPRPEVKIKNLYFDGASFYENSRFSYNLFKKIYIHKHKIALNNPEEIKQKMEYKYGSELAKPLAKELIEMKGISLINALYDLTHVKLPKLTLVLQNHTVFCYGEKDFELKRARKIIKEKYPSAKLVIRKGEGHCTSMINDPETYARQLKFSIKI